MSEENISAPSTTLLGLSATTMGQKRGIKLGPGEKFCFSTGNKSDEGKDNEKKSQKKHNIFIYEAEVDPSYAQDAQKIQIHIYLKPKDEGRVLVGTLSAAHPRVQLDLTLGEDDTLSHNSKYRDVYFNGLPFSLSPKLVKDKVVWTENSVALDTDKEIWVAEVHPFQQLEFNPIDEGKTYHLLKAYSRENTTENISLHVHCHWKTQLLGELVTDCNSIRLHTVFEDIFTLSHTSRTTDVTFFGYTVPSQPFEFKLKDLNEYARGLSEHSLKASPKISVDPEYQSYKGILAKGPIGTSKQPEINPVAMSPLTAPPIFANGVPKREISDGKKATGKRTRGMETNVRSITSNFKDESKDDPRNGC